MRKQLTHIFVFGFLLCLLQQRAFSQITIAVDSINCASLSTTLHATITGDIPTGSGITADDGYSGLIPIGFTYNFYGTPYTDLVIGSNGNLCFNAGLAGSGDPWPVSAALLGNSSVYNCICGPWCDIYIPDGGTITYSTDGVAPNRKFAVTWCGVAMYSCWTEWITTQIIIYETSNLAEVHLGHRTVCSTGWNGSHAIIGVQNAIGSDAVAAPGRDYPAVWTAVDEAWRFAPSGTTYTVSSIPYAPIPYSSSTIYWYDSLTGAYLGSGPSLLVSPLVTTTYKAVALGCGDSSFTFIRVPPVLGLGPEIRSFTTGTNQSTYTNPTECGLCDGTISLHGGIAPGYSDTVNYLLGGVLQPPVITTAASDSSITLTGLCAGTYTNITVTQGRCISPPAGPVTLSNPSFTISSFTHTDPSICGASDATLTLYGLIPGTSVTINFLLGGVAQTPVVLTVSSSGSVTLTGLCGGIYTDITATMYTCTTPGVGPVDIINPIFAITDTASTNATCSACDGTITLKGLTPGQAVTVNYNFNGAAAAPRVLTSTGGGTVTLTNLCPGTYDNITATLASCAAGACVAGPVGTFNIVPPPLIPINFISATNPTECGKCNGVVLMTGLPPYTTDTLFYTLYGAATGGHIINAYGDSTFVTGGLCDGVYDNFFVKVGPCPTTVINNPQTLISPPMTDSFDFSIFYGCKGDTVVFVNRSTNPSPLHSHWDFGDGYSDTTTSPVHIYAQGTYTVALTVTNLYCTATRTATITLVHPLQAALSTDHDTICQGNAVLFGNTSTGSAPLTYMWYFGDGANSTAISQPYTYNNTGVYHVQLIATNFVPCHDTATTTIYVDSQTVISLALTDSVLCRSTYVTFTGTYTGIGNTGNTWSFGDLNSIENVNPVVHAFDNTGTFVVTLTAHYRACHDTSASRTVTVYPGPSIDLGPDTAICAGGEAITLMDKNNAGNPAASWLWNTGQKTPSILVDAPGNYYATVSINNCRSSDSVMVQNDCYMNIPNIFTPNGDGLNDYFYPRQLLSKGLIAFKMDIYNRWGQLVFETESLDGAGWDGKLNATPQPEGVYVYIIEATFKDGQKEHHQGNVTLLR